jgi:hypothetical protein
MDELSHISSFWIFFELITLAQNEHSKFRPKLFHVSKGTVNYFVNIHTTQLAKSAWWSPPLQSVSKAPHKLLPCAGSRTVADCLRQIAFASHIHYYRRLCHKYQRFRPSIATAQNSPKIPGCAYEGCVWWRTVRNSALFMMSRPTVMLRLPSKHHVLPGKQR